MCGIAGVIGRGSAPRIERDARQAMQDLRHRGPDDEGMLSWTSGSPIKLGSAGTLAGDVIFFHTRLAIIDLSSGSHQPMLDDSSNFAICYNGEIYNYLELRQELEAAGCVFRTKGDVEVALLAYRAWGTRAFQRFEGMFALAILDLRKNVVVLARDFAGMKPLYTATDPMGNIAFASEIPTLVDIAKLERRADPRAVVNFVAFGITDGVEQTLWSGVKSVKPGSWMSIPIAGGTIESGQHWTLPGPSSLPLPFGAAAKRARNYFLESINLHLRSDVPIGISLSGGLDSSAIAGAIKHLVKSSRHITAYGFVSDEERFDETKWMNIASSTTGIDLRFVKIDTESFWSDIQTVIKCQGEPFTSLSVLAQYRLFQQMQADGIKVAIGGQGADEIFGGYPNVFDALFRSASRRQDWFSAMRWSLTGLELGGKRNVEFLSEQYQRYSFWSNKPPKSANRRLKKEMGLAAAWCGDHDVATIALPSRALAKDFSEYQADLFQVSSLPRLLRYEDRNAMAHGIENRVPFVYRPLVEIARLVPEHFQVGLFGGTKKLLRTALREFIPRPIARRTEKIGFSVSDERLLRGHAKRVTERLDELCGDLPCFDRGEVLRRWNAVLAGEQAYTPIVWRWLSLACWMDSFGVRA